MSDDDDVRADLRAALLRVECDTCHASIDEPCRHKPYDVYSWHVSRKKSAGVYDVPPSSILRALGVHPTQGRRVRPRQSK
jgi:hypothetical protein